MSDEVARMLASCSARAAEVGNPTTWAGAFAAVAIVGVIVGGVCFVAWVNRPLARYR